MGSRSRQQSTADLERAKRHGTDQIMESEDPCEPPYGLYGGLFVNRSEALRFAMLENGHRPQAVIMVPGNLEFSIGRPAKAAGNDSTRVAETNRRVLASSRSPHTADRISKSLC
jgi:hypothetical protein